VPQKTTVKVVRIASTLWGILGISFIFVGTIARVLPYSIEALRSSLHLFEWLVLIVWCIFMLVAEGYRGFQKQFSPRVAARAAYLLNEKPQLVDIIFSPLFFMGYFHATRKRVISTWSLTFGIILLVIIVRHTMQPWRGIIDLGIIIGLAYGLGSIYYFVIRTTIKGDCIADPEIK
jgi:hypothetical protein